MRDKLFGFLERLLVFVFQSANLEVEELEEGAVYCCDPKCCRGN